MSLFGLSVAIVLTFALLTYSVYPLVLKRQQTTTAFISRQRERALAYYERVLTNIRDLDEDHVTGKIETGEYEAEREFWVERGVQLLKLLDELSEQHTLVDNDQADDAEIDAAIEDAIQNARLTLAQEAS